MHPYSIVEEEGFKEYSRGLDPHVKLMSRQTATRLIKDRYSVMRLSLTATFEKIKYICVTADVWTCDGKKGSFLGCTAHWIDDALTHRSVALSCRRFKGTHSFDRIAELRLKIFKEYKIPVTKIVKGVTDSGANFLKSFSEFSILQCEDQSAADNDILPFDIDDQDTDFIVLSDIFDEPTDDETQVLVLPPHHPCSSHKLNLIPSVDIIKSKKATKLQHSAFGKCTGIWNKQSRSTKAAERIKELCGIYLITPVATRWNSFHDSLVSLLAQDNHISDICKLVGVVEFKTSELEFLRQYLKCVQPIAIALDRLQGEFCTFYGELIPTLLSIEKQLEKLKEQKPTHCEYLPQLLLECLRKRFKDFLELSLDHSDAIIATVAHPYFKLRWVPKEKMELVKTLFLDEMCRMTVPSAAADLEDRSDAKASTSNKFEHMIAPSSDAFFDFGSFQEATESGEDSNEKLIRDECNAYLRSESDQISMLHNFPNFKQAFVKYNTPLPSSAPIERLFNYAKMILNPKRRRLTDQNFEINTLLKVNYY